MWKPGRCGPTLEQSIGTWLGTPPGQKLPWRSEALAKGATVPFDGGSQQSIDNRVRVPSDSLLCTGQWILRLADHLLVALKH